MIKYLSIPLSFISKSTFYQRIILFLGLSTIILSTRSALADRSLTEHVMKEFNGIGLKGDYYYNSRGADGSLGIAVRSGTLGLIGFGGVGSVNYRFNSQLISGHAGVDAYLLAFGLQCALAWQIDGQQNRADFGINYGLKFMLSSAPHPMFLTIGGQSYAEAPTEFFISYSIFTSLGGQSVKRRPKPNKYFKKKKKKN